MKFSLEWTEARCPFGSLQFDSLIYTLYALKEHTNNHVQRFSVLKLYSAHHLFPLFCSHAGVAAKHPWDFTVLCEAVRAKVTCLAIDCILLHWFPYEMGSSPQVWQRGRVQCFLLPAAFFFTFRHTHRPLKWRPRWWKAGTSLRCLWHDVDSCFLNGWPFIVFPYRRKCTLLCHVLGFLSLNWSFFRVTLPVMSLQPCWHLFLCHCGFPVGFKAFWGASF